MGSSSDLQNFFKNIIQAKSITIASPKKPVLASSNCIKLSGSLTLYNKLALTTSIYLFQGSTTQKALYVCIVSQVPLTKINSDQLNPFGGLLTELFPCISFSKNQKNYILLNSSKNKLPDKSLINFPEYDQIKAVIKAGNNWYTNINFTPDIETVIGLLLDIKQPLPILGSFFADKSKQYKYNSDFNTLTPCQFRLPISNNPQFNLELSNQYDDFGNSNTAVILSICLDAKNNVLATVRVPYSLSVPINIDVKYTKPTKLASAINDLPLLNKLNINKLIPKEYQKKLNKFLVNSFQVILSSKSGKIAIDHFLFDVSYTGSIPVPGLEAKYNKLGNIHFILQTPSANNKTTQIAIFADLNFHDFNLNLFCDYAGSFRNSELIIKMTPGQSIYLQDLAKNSFQRVNVFLTNCY